MYSRNPVENRAIFEALASKADVDKLARVAITGYYKDLKGVPCELPNPQSLIIKNIIFQTKILRSFCSYYF